MREKKKVFFNVTDGGAILFLLEVLMSEIEIINRALLKLGEPPAPYDFQSPPLQARLQA